MNLMRYTIIDRRGGGSFVAHCDAFTALVAACAHDPATLEEMLDAADSYYGSLRDYVLSGLAIFDERNVPGSYEAARRDILTALPWEQPVFRVVDDFTRETSLRPGRA